MNDVYKTNIRNFFADNVNDIVVDQQFRQCILPQGTKVLAHNHIQDVQLDTVDVLRVRSVGKIVLVNENGQETVHPQKIVNGVFMDR